MNAELHLKISGDVQGVGFRFSALRQARRLGLRGYARNPPDGTVEILAQGPRDKLEEFLAWSRSGPAAASVSRVESSWREPARIYDDFTIVS